MSTTKKKKKKSILPVIFFILIFIAGLSLLLYPTISTLWNNVYQSHAAVEYTEIVSQLTPERIEEIRQEARDYNELIYARDQGEYIPEEALQEAYQRVLYIREDGIMGILSIPKINVRLPIYHGTGSNELQKGVGHMEGSSLPIGGPNTHCALSGHTGLPSARLLTDLDRLEVGDYFVLEILDELLYYQVDQISVVLPHQTSSLKIIPDMDLCTLVTCTPYGVNSHRLLVRGVRVVTDEPIPDKVLAAGNPDYVPVTTPDPEAIAPGSEDDPNYDPESGDLRGVTFNRNMPWWLRNVYTPIYIAIGAVFLLLAGLLLPRIFRKKKKKQPEEEQKAEEEQKEAPEEKDAEAPDDRP
ncbi:MAG: class C sortase [Oscillospiraceae bacterium]|nr:class C sortase [Oscillospiraceae bacterium]